MPHVGFRRVSGCGALTGRRRRDAMAGGLVAGLALSAVMLVGEKLSGKPSELIELERKTAAKLNIKTPPYGVPATTTEQLITHGGHLALSALAGLIYATVVDEDADDARSGAIFGIAFFVAAYGITGPALGVTPLPWRERPLRAVQHPIVHTLFGLAMARFARRGGAIDGDPHSRLPETGSALSPARGPTAPFARP